MTGAAESNRVRVAVVGTGRMGGAMAGRLAKAGHPLTLWNRTRSAAESVAIQCGGEITVADTARDAARDADVVIVSLADDAAARETYRGDDGLVAGLGPGTVVADTSTVAPETTRGLEDEVRATGAVLVDTPVSGSVSSVESGTILVMAGGEADDVERARPALESFAQRIILLGPLGSGSTMKLAVNAMVFGLNQTLAEALVLAEKAGVERELAYEVIANSAVAAPFVGYKRAAYEHPESAAVAFALDLVAKDLDLAAALAVGVGAAMPQLETNRRVVGDAIAAGLGGADLSALAVHLRSGDRDSP
jgi:3-hydroxyisobutyrate dehydrogenase-like beta-hydroxyacid dehydrogenase